MPRTAKRIPASTRLDLAQHEHLLGRARNHGNSVSEELRRMVQEGLTGSSWLPSVHLSVSGDVFMASGSSPCPWSIRAEAETGHAARTRICVDGREVADVTIHGRFGYTLPEETQEVAAGLLWSALRAWRMRA